MNINELEKIIKQIKKYELEDDIENIDVWLKELNKKQIKNFISLEVYPLKPRENLKSLLVNAKALNGDYYLEDMIHETLKLPYYYPKILRYLNFKDDMNEDYNFVNEVLTPFQKEKIEIIIKNALEYNFNYSLKYNPYEENTDYIMK